MLRTYTWSKLLAFVLCIHSLSWITLILFLGDQKPDLEVTQLDSKSQLREEVREHIMRDSARRKVKETPTPVEAVYNKTVTSAAILKIKEKIKSIAKLVHSARKHVRGSKTSDLLKKATDAMDDLLSVLKIESSSVYERTTYKSTNICPEKYKGTQYGAPFFYKGFETSACSYNTPLSKLVTIVKQVELHGHNLEANDNEIKSFISSAYEIDANFHISLGLDMLKISPEFNLWYQNVTIMDSKGKSPGNVMNDLVDAVRTPYVLIARNAEFLTHDMRLERLVREIEQLHVPVAGGAFRDQNGHWKKGCFQTGFRNFTLKYLEGYDESLHECLFCDYVQGPFVTTTDYLKTRAFDNLDESEGLYEEWFLRMFQSGAESIVCPDSMFHVNSGNHEISNWEKLTKKWNVFRCVTPTGIPIVRKCSSFKYDSAVSKAVHMCSLQYNADAIKHVMGICEEAGIICELQEGTALGAVKLGKVLPWERDIDLTFLTANYTAFEKLRSTFLRKGFAFTEFDKRWCCVDNTTAGGQFTMRYKGWNIEMYGQHKMDSQLLTENGIKPTKVHIDGHWANVPRNPGLFVRNRYGREVYQHAEHWMTTGDKNGWINYHTNHFQPCVSEGDHDCLDRYSADGDLSFTDMLP